MHIMKYVSKMCWTFCWYICVCVCMLYRILEFSIFIKPNYVLSGHDIYLPFHATTASSILQNAPAALICAKVNNYYIIPQKTVIRLINKKDYSYIFFVTHSQNVTCHKAISNISWSFLFVVPFFNFYRVFIYQKHVVLEATSALDLL